jgi:hypothetical protein
MPRTLPKAIQQLENTVKAHMICHLILIQTVISTVRTRRIRAKALGRVIMAQIARRQPRKLI